LVCLPATDYCCLRHLVCLPTRLLLFTSFGLSSYQTLIVYDIWFVFLPQTIVVLMT
jgi:hypothetical protein